MALTLCSETWSAHLALRDTSARRRQLHQLHALAQEQTSTLLEAPLTALSALLATHAQAPPQLRWLAILAPTPSRGQRCALLALPDLSAPPQQHLLQHALAPLTRSAVRPHARHVRQATLAQPGLQLQRPV